MYGCVPRGIMSVFIGNTQKQVFVTLFWVFTFACATAAVASPRCNRWGTRWETKTNERGFSIEPLVPQNNYHVPCDIRNHGPEYFWFGIHSPACHSRFQYGKRVHYRHSPSRDGITHPDYPLTNSDNLS